MTNKPTIMLTTGGTGGHIFPALALGKHLDNLGFEVILATDARGLEWLKSQNNQLKTLCFPSSTLSGGNLFFKIKALILIIIGTLQALLKLRTIKPALIVGFGSYASFPVMSAGMLLNIPFIIHEQNAVLGKANRFFAKKAKLVATSFSKTELVPENTEIVFTGMPVRQEIEAIKDTPITPPSETFRILVTGGSQGSSIFSTIVPKAVLDLPEELRNRIEITEQCRHEDIEKVKLLYEGKVKKFKVASFFDNIPSLLKECHLVICRAGSSTIAELSVAKRPAILVPLPNSADNHQTINAQNFCENGGGWLIPQKDFSITNLNKKIEELIKNTHLLVKMAENIDSFTNLNSINKLETIINNLINEKEI